MSNLRKIILESLQENPLGIKDALKEELNTRIYDLIESKFKPGDKVKYETSKYSKDNQGVVKSHDGDQVTITGNNWLGGNQDIQVHQGFVRKE